VEWIVRRLFRDGQLIGNRQLAQAQEVRGRLSIREQADETRHRRVRVAQIVTPTAAAEAIRPLYDVQLLGSLNGGQWSLTGYERAPTAVHAGDCIYGQTWLIRPGPDDDLLKAYDEIDRMVRLLVQHGIDPRTQPTS
jgi:hypothetical protein